MKLAVGTDKTILNVHQKILCTSSKFFQNASKPEWASSRSAPDTIDLTDESLGIVKSYVRWLYLGVLPKPGGSLDLDFNNLTNAYLFGERMMDIKYKNAVLDQLIAVAFILATPKYQCYPPAEALRVVYKGTSPGSGARRLLADFIAYNAKEDDPEWNQEMESYKGEMWMDVMKAMTRLRKPEPGYPWMISSAPYRQDES
ncbi:hypothetical protein BU26DRAFT_480267 [Trematosphaeria pertusa]|uniref:BTB domain-containing protein n=1 Tax=Trematosphaeria pertusa TaxID=390896 RepID=A0A6A6ISH5_9PLEO|nr:uncharacterized protein BU26DRAFT_480267 [Trematosphaeria pertusa]KAF2252550.1 hypothetical protein BU26DRAFT_480267 [Trematosphaeria pertusa]